MKKKLWKMSLTGVSVSIAAWYGIFPVHAGTLQEDLKFYLSCDDMTPPVPGCRIQSSIRLRPGKFGKSFLIERRTENSASPGETILGNGAVLQGTDNILTLPPNGFAALPFPQIKPGSENCLSFLYKGSGRITVELDSGNEKTTLAELTASGQERHAAITVIPKGDSATLRIRSDQPVVLRQLMFDRDIPFANTYQPPGQIRNVDWIVIPPQLFDRRSGAFACWIKAPWLNKSSTVSRIGLLSVRWAKTTKGKVGTNHLKWISLWNGKIYDANRGKDSSAQPSFQLKDLEQKNADAWHHFVFNWNYADGILKAEILVDGKLADSKTTRCILNPEPIDFIVGYAVGYYLNGQMDDIALFKRPLTGEEVRKIVSAEKPIPEAIR